MSAASHKQGSFSFSLVVGKLISKYSVITSSISKGHKGTYKKNEVVYSHIRAQSYISLDHSL